MSKLRIYNTDAAKENEEESILDCLSAWQLFIHREIAHVITQNPNLCGMTPDVVNYSKLLNGFFSKFKTSGFKKTLQRITKGRIKISGLGAGIEAEAEFIDDHGNVDVSEFVRYCNGVISGIDFNSELENSRINIFFDELNISYVTGSDFRINAVLIRDLVAACGKMNLMFAEYGLPIYIYTAVRSEVVESVESNVREIQKWIDDKAVLIDWILPHEDYLRQPLVDLLRKRIYANEKRLNGKKTDPSDTKLRNYFETEIKGLPFGHHLIFDTWGRPRDLVRLLSLTAKYVERNQKFDTDAFNKSLPEYSKSCWNEKQDELNSKYSQSQISTMKRLLTGYQPNFSRTKIDAHIAHMSRNDARTTQFFSGRNVDVFLEDLFKVGILGNLLKTRSGSMRPSYLYMGHNNFNANEILCVHRSLWKELQMTMAETKIGASLKNHKRKYDKKR